MIVPHPLLASLACLCLPLAALAQPATQPATIPAPPEPTGMQSIFNGKDLSGWEGDMKFWSVADGVIRGKTTKDVQPKSNTFLVWRGGTVADFELRLSFRITQEGNSGVQYRSRERANFSVVGYQAEVDNNAPRAAYLYDEGGRLKLCLVGQKVVVEPGGKPSVVGSLGDQKAIESSFKPGGWNDLVIIAKGNHLMHFLNGIQRADIIDNDEKDRDMSGILALQVHAGLVMTVEFRDIRIKRE